MYIRIFLVFVGLLQISLTSYTQNFQYQWGTSFGDTSFERARAIAVDTAGNVYATGSFNGTADIILPVGSATLFSSGGEDIFLMKVSPAGNLLWAYNLGSTGADRANGIAVDVNQDIYLTGFFQNTVDFDISSGTELSTSAGGSDIFILKLSSDGNFVWVKTIGSPQTQSANDLEIDHAGNVLVIGEFEGNVDFDPGPGVTTLNSSNSFFNVFILKLDVDGNFIWGGAVGSDFNDSGHAIVADNHNNVYATGGFVDFADFDPDPAIDSIYSAGAYENIFVLKLTSSGVFSWCKNYGDPGTYQSSGRDITSDGKGNILVVGDFDEDIDFKPGESGGNIWAANSQDGYLLKLDTSGNFNWAKSIGGMSSDAALGVTTDTSGNAYAIGNYSDQADFGNFPWSSDIHNSEGFTDIYVCKYKSNGVHQWTLSLGGSGADQPCEVKIRDTLMYVFGEIEETVDFNPDTTITANFISEGFRDIGLLHFSLPVVLADTNTTAGTDINQSAYVIYPNPFSEVINISNPTNRSMEISVFDSSGKLIQSLVSDEANTKISVQDLPDGLYVIKITDHSGVNDFKMVKVAH